jgi:hypothetical protein
MSDDKKKVGHPDSDLISIKEPYEKRDWAKRLGVSEEKLVLAVQAVGHSKDKVADYLKKH